MLCVDIQRETLEASPDDEDIRRTVACAIAAAGLRSEGDYELSLRIVDGAEMQALNGRFRNKHATTNVLSFPADLPAHLELPLLGDLVICAPVVHREAREQGKAVAAHWHHMLVHGTLHLLGYDHIEDADAELMEALETCVLATLGWPCPYTYSQVDAPESPPDAMRAQA